MYLSRRQVALGVGGALIGGTLGPTTACADDKNLELNSWQDLTDEQSRGDIFRQAVLDHTLGIPPGIFNFPSDARFDQIKKRDRTDAVFGVDLSHHNERELDFEALYSHDIRFVYIKATQGAKFKDNKFGYFWKKIDALPSTSKIYRGAYHFLSSDVDGKVQAERFLSFLELNGGHVSSDLPLVMDLEDDRVGTGPDLWKGRGAQYILENALGFLNKIREQTNRTPLIYTYKAWFNSETIPLDQFYKLNEFPIWIADYNGARKLEESPALPSNIKPLLWQFTNSAMVKSGYNRPLDASIFKGSFSDFKRTLLT